MRHRPNNPLTITSIFNVIEPSSVHPCHRIHATPDGVILLFVEAKRAAANESFTGSAIELPFRH